MTALASFQDAFADALLAAEPSAASAAAMPDLAALVLLPAFAVYRNTVLGGLIDAIVANHPAVARLVGDEWLRAAASVFVRSHPPAHPTLADYGEGFDRFLAGFGPAAGLPYLPPVARLDRAWTEAHAARNEPAADPASIAALAPEQLADAVLVPHAATRWAWSDEHPIHALWSRNRDPGRGDSLADIAWRGEGVLVTRPRDDVRWIEVGYAHCAFLDACAAGRSLAEAAAEALDADGGADLARMMTCLLDAGAFAGLSAADGASAAIATHDEEPR